MTCGTPESGASAERLDEILAEYLLARERGEATPDEAFIAAHPEAAGELREFFCNRRDFAALASPGGKGGADVESTLRLSAALGMIEDVELAGRALQPCQRIFGDYELLQEIGRGGMGVVFKARQISLDRIVALKMILSGRLASPEEVKRFQFEAQAAATLDHGSIVQIFNVGELHGQHYFTMKLIEGGSLAKRIAEFEAKPRETAQLVAEIAGAVHHAHQRLILHRDLKPSNVLIDGAGKPHVSDFGLACRQGAHELTESGAVLGAPGYMSPEQASGRVKAITTASDVYSLGAILYDLLTGRPPFRGETVTETIRQVIERQPLRPRSIKGRVDPDLEAVCLKCLEKEPSRRYASAAGLVRDLERYLAGQPVEARRPGRAERAWRWCLRYPMWAASLAAAGVFLVIMTIAALAAAKEYEHELMRNQAKADSFGALHAANTIHSQLTHYASAVVDAAKNPELRGELTRLGRLLNEQHSNARELSNKGELSRLEQVIAGLYRRYNRAGGPYRSANENEPFDSLFVQTTRGIGLIRSPNSPREWTGADFQYRDYFQGAMKRAEAAAKGQPTPYVSGVFVSYSNDLAKFAISMPIIADDGSRRMVGVLAATITTGATFGPIPLGDEHRKVVLVGPKDPSQAGPPNHSATRPDQPPEYVVVVDRSQRRQLKHVSYVRSERLTAFAVPLQQGDLPRSQYATDDNYEDPNEGGRWQAGFAQVGNTGLVVVVQTPYGQPLQPGRTLARELGFWLAVAATVGGALLLAGAVYRHRAGWSRWRIALAPSLSRVRNSSPS